VSVYVRLRVDSEAFAIPVGHVLEVAELGEVAVVPRARPEMLGVRNVRGQILPVIDLALLLGIPQTTVPGRLVVAEDGARRAAFAVDQVSGVGELADPTEETVSDLLAGAILADGSLIGVINMPRVFASLQGPSSLPGPNLPPGPDSPAGPDSPPGRTSE
jgi:chemotaxis signal transduction protein